MGVLYSGDLGVIFEGLFSILKLISDFDPFGAQSAPVQQETSDDFFIEQATVTPAAPVVEAPPAEPVAPVYTMPKIEPEIIKQWREDFKLRTEKIEADASQEVQS